MDRRALLLGGVSAVAAGGGFNFLSQGRVGFPGISAAMAQTEQAEIDTSVVLEKSLGDPNAPIKFIEYASFTCPHCRRFHVEVFDRLKANYIDTGKVHFVNREVYFDRYGLWAGMLARCSEDRYFDLADLIYQEQQNWTKGADEGEIVQNLFRLGIIAGLNQEEMTACLNDGAKAQAMVAVFQQNAAVDGINSTPTFLIDGEKYSNMNYADFAAVLDEKRGG